MGDLLLQMATSLGAAACSAASQQSLLWRHLARFAEGENVLLALSAERGLSQGCAGTGSM